MFALAGFDRCRYDLRGEFSKVSFRLGRLHWICLDRPKTGTDTEVWRKQPRAH